MRGHASESAGLSLVEVVIAMLVLGIIAIALLPPLVQGIRYASEQSTQATATRFLNQLVEEARKSTSCTELSGFAAPRSTQDGRGDDLVGQGSAILCPAPLGEAARITFTVTSAGKPLASTTALVYIP
jgi:type II secretory pathway pseudopilin PulG